MKTYHPGFYKRNYFRTARFVRRKAEAIRRLSRMQRATSRQIAQGVALGVFLAFAAPPGLQLIPGLLIAALTGASRVATAVGVFVSNPLTMPLIYPASYRLGSWVTGYFRPVPVPDDTEEIWQAAISEATPQFLLVNMWVGLLLLGSVFGILAFYVVGWTLDRFERQHKAKSVV